MTNIATKRKLDEILIHLAEIPLQLPDPDSALKSLTELCREALCSRACTLVWIDLERRILTHVASAGFDDEFEALMAGRKFKLGAPNEGVSLSYDAFAQGGTLERYNLQSDGGGIASPELAQKYGLQSALCHPLKIGGRLVGALNHFSSRNEEFTDDEKRVLKLFSLQAENILKQSNQERSLKVAAELAPELLRLTPDGFLKLLANKACGLIPDSACIVWKLDRRRERLRVVSASEGVDQEYRGITLDLPRRKNLLAEGKAEYLADVRTSQKYRLPDEARARGWVSLLSVPMKADGELIGLLDVYTRFPHEFSDWELSSFESLATFAAVSIQKADLQRETDETITQRQRLELINTAMTQMAEERDVDKILRLLLTNSLKLVGTRWGWVRRLNASTGVLEVTAKFGTSWTPRPLRYGEGVSWKAVIEREPQLAADVRSSKWQKWYVEFSPETRSELTMPLVVDNVFVREGSKTKLRSRAVGVLNLESPEVGAFTESDITYLLPLVRQAALLIDRLEVEHKSYGVRDVEREIVGKRNWREVLETVVKGIKETLGFEYVNVSLVDSRRRIIKTEYVVGIPEGEIETFKKMAVHSLDSDDLTADVIRKGRIEVPGQNDPRFDMAIFERFGHEHLIRVFIPMRSSSNGEAIGTVEAGYSRRYRDYIYESDVQFLKSFIAYAVEAIDPSRLALLETVSHELRSSIVGIRGNADYLRLGGKLLPWDRMETKLNDIIADSEILLLNVGELEYFLGRTSRAPKIEATLVVRDIVIKTVNQLKPLVRERNFNPSRIEYPPREAVRKIRIYADRARLNEVVYNLLLNAIKYAEDDPEEFSIQISMEEQAKNFVLKFADWGVGVKGGLEAKIFDLGFRAPEARARNVSGSGLGLTIARQRMKEIGGDLILVNNYKPTEFHMVIPKKLTEAPE